MPKFVWKPRDPETFRRRAKQAEHLRSYYERRELEATERLLGPRPHPIAVEIIKATNFPEKLIRGRQGQVLYEGLLQASNRLSDADWHKLSTETQRWLNWR